MDKFDRAFQLMKASWSVLRSRKELALFPVLSGVANVLVTLTFLTPAAALSWNLLGGKGAPNPVSYVLLGLFYFATAYVTIFFNAALISQADVALAGGDPSVKAGLRVAAANWARILPWAALSATVSVVLRAIEERFGFIGRMVVGLIGIAWNMIAFLVLPVLVLEQIGVRDALRKASEMFKRTWGENAIGGAGFGLLGFVAMLPAVVLVSLAAKAGLAVLLAAVALAVVWLLVVTVFTTAMSGVYQTALYRYAATGTTAPAFAGVGAFGR